jgi:ABC-type amino acid transport substrate-binding protein
MPRPAFLLLAAGLWCSGLHGQAVRDITFVAPTNLSMPLAHFDGDQLDAGILKDLGDAIAQRLGMRARFLPQPSKRVGPALLQGKADGVCYVLPRWLDGSFDWSPPVIPNAGVVAASSDTPPLRVVTDLADKPLGTVLGYRYPEFEEALGSHFLREDAPTMDANIRKLAAGRMRYAIVELNSLAYFLRGEPTARLKPVLPISTFTTQCAFSRQSKLPFTQVNEAVTALLADGSVERILARYR